LYGAIPIFSTGRLLILIVIRHISVQEIGMVPQSVLAVSVLCAVMLSTVLYVSADIVPEGDNIGYFLLKADVDGATVYFDSTLAGITENGQLFMPVDVTGTPYRTYTVQKNGYRTYHGYILANPLPRETVVLHADLIADSEVKPGILTINTTPPKASIFLNGKPAGQTPATGFIQFVNYPPGDYNLQLRIPGYKVYEETVHVYPDSETRVEAFLQENLTGTISVISFPKGATVYLDGSKRGETPVDLTNVTYGTHKVLLTLPGYQDWSAEAIVKPDTSTPLTARLVALPGSTPAPVPTSTRMVIPDILVILSVAGAGLIACRKRGSQ
jgi:hypothetical protein